MWVSRRVWESKESEIAWLRTELMKVRDHERRIERKQNELPEVAPEPKPRQPMPDALREMVDEFPPGAIRDRFLEELNDAYRRKRDWGVVMDAVIQQSDGLGLLGDEDAVNAS